MAFAENRLRNGANLHIDSALEVIDVKRGGWANHNMHCVIFRCALLVGCVLLASCSWPPASTTSESSSSPISTTSTEDASETPELTPHEYLSKGKRPDKAIAMMAADPTWITTGDQSGRTPLHVAARHGPPSAVEWLLAHGADVNAIAFMNSLTPLHCARDPAIVRILLEKKPDLMLRDTNGETPLQQAAAILAWADTKEDQERWREIVKLYGAAMGGVDLFTAITLDDLPRVKEILSQSPELADDFQERSPLRKAASRGHVEICRYLLENHRVDVDDFERGLGYPIIMEAIEHPKVVRLLIEYGADLKTRITWLGGRTGIWVIGDDATALHYAAAYSDSATVNLLIDNGVDIFAVAHESGEDDGDQTALDVAAIFGRAETASAIVNHRLFESGNPDERQAILDRCLALCMTGFGWPHQGADRPKLIEVLLRKGANPNATLRGFTALQWAVSDLHGDSAKIVRRCLDLLLERGATVDLHSAVLLDDLPRVNSFLANDRTLANVYGPEGTTALHAAVIMERRDMVAALLKAGADVNLREKERGTDELGDTPLDYAERSELEEIAQLLIEAGGKRQEELEPGQ